MNIKIQNLRVTKGDSEAVKKQTRTHSDLFLAMEFKYLSRYFWQSQQHKSWLTNPLNEIEYFKLDLLDEAVQCGLKIPKALVTSSKNDLISFKDKTSRVITKALSDPLQLIADDEGLTVKTTEVTDAFIEDLEDSFYPSFFQELLEKDYELRVFYLDNTFTQWQYSLKCDYRNR